MAALAFTAAKALMADAAALTAVKDEAILPESSAADAAADAVDAAAETAVELAGDEDVVGAGGGRARTIGTRLPIPTCRSKRWVR